MSGASTASVRNRGKQARRTSPSSGMGLSIPPYVYYCLLGLVVVFFALVRVRLRDVPLERDEGEYAYAGQLLLHGLPPYQFVYSVKLPGTYAAYAVILGLFGQNAAAIHIGLLTVNAATTLLLFLICQKLFGRLTALVAASSLALLSAEPSATGLAGHATHFVVFFAVAGIWLLLKAIEVERSSLLFCAGLLFGLAFLMKQPGLVFAAWAVVYLLQRRLIVSRDWRAGRQLTALILGAALPFAITCFVMWRTGEFHNFWFWTFTYVRQYGSAVPIQAGVKLFYMTGSRIFESAPAIWVLALVGLTAFAWTPCARSGAFFASSLLMFSLVAVSAGLYFRPHYFILLLPAVSILAGLAITCATEKLLAGGAPRLVAATPVLVFVLAFASSLYLQRDVLFRLTPAEASAAIYHSNPFVEADELAKYIQSHTRNTDTVAVLGSEPEIFFYSHRRSATGYVYMYPLLEPHGSGVRMQSQMMEEIESSRPAMLVVVNAPVSWIAYANPTPMQGITAWMKSYLDEHYVQDGVVEMGDSNRYVWGEQARDYEPRTRLSLLLFKRKDE
jgi:Dolichyl-phosphate-mannose-protein mannosyltransferase